MRCLLILLSLLCFGITGKADYYVWSIHLKEAGTLKQYSASVPAPLGLDVRISGKLNDEDFLTLSNMLEGRWCDIDLSEADFTEIPSRAFEADAIYLRKIILPATLTTINSFAFLRKDILELVDLSRCEKLNFIGRYAFGDCSKLTSLDFSNCKKLKNIGELGCVGAFQDSHLENIILPPNLEIIYGQTFENTRLKEIEIPSSVKKIYPSAFDGCAWLNKIKMNSLEPPIIEESGSHYWMKNVVLEVPSGSLLKYKKNKHWSDCLQIEEYNPNGGELIFHTIETSYNKKHVYVELNENYIKSGSLVSVSDKTDIQLSILVYAGYYLKQLLVNNIDVKSQVKNGLLVLPSISIDQNIAIETGVNKCKFEVSYNEGGTVKVNNETVENLFSMTVDAFTEIQLSIIPNQGYCLKEVNLGGRDITRNVINNKLTIDSSYSDQKLVVEFEKDQPTVYTIKVHYYDDEGRVEINNNIVSNGVSTDVKAFTDVRLSIIPNPYYHLKRVTVGGVDKTSEVRDNQFTISSISKNQEISVVFEKDASINYTVKVSYNEGGKIKVNNNFVNNGFIATVTSPADIQLSIVPDKGYHLKQVKVGTEDVTDQVVNNLLTISDILENKEIAVVFEKTSYYSFQVSISGNGKIKVDDKVIENGTSVTIPVAGAKLEFLPDNQYRVAKVLLDSKDITKEIVDNIYNITSVSSDMSLSVAFEKIPTYKFNINMTGGAGSIKIGDKTVTKSDQISDLQEGTMLGLSFLPDNYYEVKKVTLGGSDITSQIRNGYYEIQSIESDLTLSVEYQRKSYTLTLSTTQGIGNICVNQKEYKDITQIKLLSGDATIAVYSNELYYIKQVLLADKVIYDDKNGTSAYTGNIKIDIDCDKDLTVILTLREKRQLSVKIAEAGTLNSLLSEDDKRLVTSLIVEGEIDQRDFEVMNQMESLAELNLENAAVVKYGIHLANTIPDKAFYNNQKIQSMYLPKSIETIGNQSFSSSVISAFPSMEIYEYLTKIGKDAFKNCSHLVKSPNLNSVELIEEGAFENCSNMYVVGVLSNVKEIKSSAFKNCVKCSIQFITGSNDVCLEKVGDYAFENMKAVYFDEAEKLYYIGHQALKGCQNTSFNFSDCLNLTELPSFENCSKMQSIVFPPKVKRVDSNSFIGCSSLQTVHMKENISIIEEYAFKDCPMIDYVYLAAEEIPKVSVNSFCNSIYQTARLFVPVNRLQFYKEDAVWGKFENIRTVGLATEYRVELLLSEGGTVGIQHDEKDWEYYYYGYLKIAETSRIYFHVRPEQGFVIESVVLNDKDITNTLDENNQFVIPYLMENTYLDIKFKKESDPTSIDHAENAIKCVYRSAPRRLTLSGFKAGVPVYVYDSSGRLVILRTIRDGVEVVSVPAEGLYFVRIGKESFKVIL